MKEAIQKTIKARNKLTGEVVGFNAINEGSYYSYVTYIGKDEKRYDKFEFNDLFEVVEDINHPYGGLEVYDVIEAGNDKFSIAYVIPQANTLKKEDWETRFEKEFDKIYDNCGVGYGKNQAGLKHFIAQEIAKAKEEIVDKVEKLRKEPRLIPTSCPDGMIGCLVAHFEKKYTSEDKGYNQAIDDIISLIRSDEKA
jgi:hypothetical protein